MIDLDEVWFGDKFDRRQEAVDVIGYLEAVVQRPQTREDGHAHVLAVDAGYGEGKTYFLKRLDLHLKASEHVSAYIDAWTDDLEDEPLVALAATLERAFEEWSGRDTDVHDAMRGFIAKTGKLAKLAGVGLLTRAAGLALTEGVANAARELLSGGGNPVAEEMRREALKTTAERAADALAKPSEERVLSDMAERIQRFRQGQEAVREIKASLANLVEALAAAGMRLPITVIVDELDRCRPTYAIKVLEEIKHLFDVDGVAFVLGMYGDQLGKSMSAAYGAQFNGHAYLHRFVNRRYRLKEAKLSDLMDHLFKLYNVPQNAIAFPRQTGPAIHQGVNYSIGKVVAAYMKACGLTARDGFAVAEAFQLAHALVGIGLMGPLITPMILLRVKDVDLRNLTLENMGFLFDPAYGEAVVSKVNAYEMFTELQAVCKMSYDDLRRVLNAEDNPYANAFMRVKQEWREEDYGNPKNYEKLVDAVERFMPDDEEPSYHFIRKKS